MVKKLYIRDYPLPEDLIKELDNLGLTPDQREAIDIIFKGFRHIMCPESSVEKEQRLIEEFKSLFECEGEEDAG